MYGRCAEDVERRLPASVASAARLVAASQPEHELRSEPGAARALRELLEPWLAGDDARVAGADESTEGAGEGEGEGESECPICYSVVTPATAQLPRVRCVTCGGRFHADCIFKWLNGSARREDGAGDAEPRPLCPLCRCAF